MGENGSRQSILYPAIALWPRRVKAGFLSKARRDWLRNLSHGARALGKNVEQRVKIVKNHGTKNIALALY